MGHFKKFNVKIILFSAKKTSNTLETFYVSLNTSVEGVFNKVIEWWVNIPTMEYQVFTWILDKTVVVKRHGKVY